jgi:hypothetical protein
VATPPTPTACAPLDWKCQTDNVSNAERVFSKAPIQLLLAPSGLNSVCARPVNFSPQTAHDSPTQHVSDAQHNFLQTGLRQVGRDVNGDVLQDSTALCLDFKKI